MEVVKVLFDVTINAFNTQVNLFGYSFTFFDMFIFGLLVDLVAFIIYKLLN